MDLAEGMSRGHSNDIGIEPLGELARYHLRMPRHAVLVEKTGNSHPPAI